MAQNQLICAPLVQYWDLSMVSVRSGDFSVTPKVVNFTDFLLFRWAQEDPEARNQRQKLSHSTGQSNGFPCKVMPSDARPNLKTGCVWDHVPQERHSHSRWISTNVFFHHAKTRNRQLIMTWEPTSTLYLSCFCFYRSSWSVFAAVLSYESKGRFGWLQLLPRAVLPASSARTDLFWNAEWQQCWQCFGDDAECGNTWQIKVFFSMQDPACVNQSICI